MLEVVCGPMFSGKSRELLHRADLARLAGLRYHILKPIIDTRSENEVVSRSGIRHEAINAHYIIGSSPGIEGSLILVDEAQFFKKAALGDIKWLLHNSPDTRIIVFGLDMDFKREPFGYMGDYLAMANKITKLKAMCHTCKSFDACYTQRVVNGKPTAIGDQILIGDTESYEARCPKCWMK